ncbi:MAG: hypothetical protein L6R48_24705 [Planctomycetes bacterium]|nr:hypothetical protein [Planctomycetota bacterium]
MSGRLALVLVLAAAAAAVAWMLASDPLAPAQVHGAGSSLDGGSDGTALARAWLARRGPVAVLAQPLDARVDPQAVVLRLRPRQEPAPRQAHGSATAAALAARPLPWPPLTLGEEAFLRAGGRLVAALDRDQGPLAAAGTSAPVQVVLPLIPGLARLAPPVGRGFEAKGAGRALLADGAVVAAAGTRPALVRVAVGAGELWLCALPEVLDNRHLAAADHLALLAGLCGDRPVLFDEHAHGLSAGGGPLELVRSLGLGACALLAALAAAAWWWRRAHVPGGPAPGAPDLRSEAVEGVDALAGLYAVLPDRDLLAAHHARLAARLARRTGLAPAAAAAALGPVPDHPSADHLARLERAFQRACDDCHPRLR